MKKIGYVADSSLELTLAKEKELDIHIVRQHVIVEDTEYIDQLSITREQLFEFQAQFKKMSTTAPLLGDAIALFDRLLEEYETLLVFPISSTLSGFYNVLEALIGEEERYRNRVFLVNSGHISIGVQSLIKDARELEKQGLSALEIKAKIEKESNFEVFLCPSSMKYLAMGGRVNAYVAEIGQWLKIVPIISFGSQKLYVLDKVRTLRKATKVAIQELLNQIGDDDMSQYRWTFVYGNNETDEVEWALSLFQEMIGLEHEILVHQLQPTILTHTGPNALGFGRVNIIK